MLDKLVIISAVILVLSGCSAADREAWGHPDPEADDAKCRNFGAKPGSESYIQCRMYSEQRRLEIQRNNLAASAQLGTMGTNLMALGTPRYQPVTNCRMNGRTASCQTF
jgi:hypothetical protein